MKRAAILLLGLIILFFGQSCKKNESFDLLPDKNVANDVILSISSYSTIFNLLIKSRLNAEVQNTGHATIDGAGITYDSTKRQYRFTFYGVPCPDSVERFGVIRVNLSGDILQTGISARVIFDYYSEDRGTVTGIDSIVNEGINPQGQMVFLNTVRYGYMNKYYGPGAILANLTNRYKADAASLTGGQSIVFLVSGAISGQSSRGYSFNASIRGTLQDAFSCPWIVGGIIDVEVPSAEVPSGYIDFVTGDGCSDTLYYTFNESLFKVLKRKLWLKN
ncbi:MAG: hypothetical protein NTU98_12515 [Bacteroidetes bacterium]|nr:hypothetical protein [Bacteroidota bacterium]